MKKFSFCILIALFSILKAESSDDASLAKDLNNPVSSIISLPLQFNYDRFDSGDKKYTLNIQPVIPFNLNSKWNLISRTILPIIKTEDLPSGESWGVGDITQSLFLSPIPKSKDDWIWGVGPIFLIPSQSKFSAKTWGAGPTGVVLRQKNSFTYGVLANHIWSINGDTNINQTLIQPFISYTTQSAISYGVSSETTYNWQAESGQRWSIPVVGFISKVTKIGDQRVSFGLGLKYNIKTPNGTPKGWGARFVMTFIFPK